MSIDSFENFSEQLQQLPLQNPPKGLLLDVQNTIQRRKTRKRRLLQCSVVLSLFVATLWVVVDQQSKFPPESAVVESEGVEESGETEAMSQSVLPTEFEFPQQPSSTTLAAIVFRITDIDQEIEKLPQSATARRQELLETHTTLRETYRSIRLQQQSIAHQRVAHSN